MNEAPGIKGGGRRETLRLGFLFGTLYFVQGIGEPTEGLISQPVRSLLHSWKRGPGEIAAFSALLALPWSLKPLFGLLTDFVPLAGSRRKSYLIITSAAAVVGFLGVGLLPLPSGNHRWLFAWLIVPTIAVAFSDVVTDALMVEIGQPSGLTGWLQSVQWTCMYTASILTGVLGGYLSQHARPQLGFIVCGAFAVVTLLVSIFGVREPVHDRAGQGLRTGLTILWQAARSPEIWSIGGFLFLWNFNPFSTTVLQLHMKELGFSDQFYGNTVAFLSVGSIVASIAYGTYCRRVPMPWLVHASIVLGIVATLAYWAIGGTTSAKLVALVVGFAYMTATLIQFDLAARSCPPRVAGTAFALLMALSNLGMSLSTWVGGDWYERGSRLWGNHTSFNVLVGVGAAFTAGCWLLVPFLPRGSSGPARADVET